MKSIIVADLVSKKHGDGATTFTQLPHAAAFRLGTKCQKHKARLRRCFAPIAEDLGLAEPVQSHDRLLQKRHLSHQDRRRFRAFRQLLLQSLIRLQTPVDARNKMKINTQLHLVRHAIFGGVGQTNHTIQS